MGSYHVSEFDVDTVTIILFCMCIVLTAYICTSRNSCTECDFVEDPPVAFAFSVPQNIACPRCGTQIRIETNRADEYEYDSDYSIE